MNVTASQLALAVLYFMNNAMAFAQHPNAYSSPQYAKRMQYQNFHDQPQRINLNPYQTGMVPVNQIMNRNSVDYPISEDEGQLNNSTQIARSSTFIQAATDFLSGRGGQMIAEIAKDLIARSTGSSSQVLSLNLTNLIILIVLKALVLAAGMFGAGAWKYGYGRSIDENKNVDYMTESELLLYLGYLLGEQTNDYSCLYRMGCQNHNQAKLYTNGADILLQTTKLMKGTIPYNPKYERVIAELQQASSWGAAGMPCDARYRCSKPL